MKNKHDKKSLIILLVIAILFIGIFATSKSEDNTNKLKDIYEIADHPISMMDGSTYADIAIENGYLNENSVINRYNSEIDALQALRNGKVDAFLDNELFIQEFLEKYDDITVFPGSVGTIDYAFGFQKDNPLKEDFNKALAQIKEDGTYDELYEKWYVADITNTNVIDQDWVGSNGTLKYWVNVGSPPIAYISNNGDVQGFSVDIVLHICKLLDYNVEVTQCDFSGIIPALISGRCDFGGRSMAVTEEREKQIDFSDSFMENNLVYVVRTADVDESILSSDTTTNNKNIFSSIADSFVATFITEDRYQLFLTGILNTLLITIISALVGSILGFLLYFVYYKDNKTINKVIDTLANYLAGIPAVVFIMIMYYIIFKKSIFDEMVISIISFSILFAIGVFGLFKAGFNAINKGQIEAAIDLGFTSNQTLSLILVPQIIVYIFPLYRSKIVEHLKATAIVGYIAVLDLTKMSDLVRSRTFEAFFPLIVTAIIYYALGRILDFVLMKIEKKVNDGTSLMYKRFKLK